MTPTLPGATPATPTPTAPTAPVRRRWAVAQTRAVGAYTWLRLVEPSRPDGVRPGVVRSDVVRPDVVRPGQFVTVAVGAPPGEATATVLRRAFSVHRAAPSGPEGACLEIVVAPAGPGSTWVTRRRPGDMLDVVGPLGRPFPAPAPGGPVVLVGGGYGSAPLGWWARELRAAGHPVAAVIGAADADRLFGADDLRDVVDPLVLTTDDGSVGLRGRVTDGLDALLPPGATVYACGPMAMLRAVTAVTTAHGGRTWCAVEESMACGIGVCMTCVLPMVGSDGRTRMTRTCTQGPTVDGARVRWDAVGTGPGGGTGVPDDCVGAPTARAH